MPLSGGFASTFGNRYGQWWTVSQFVRILSGEAESIRIEKAAVEKAEFGLLLATIKSCISQNAAIGVVTRDFSQTQWPNIGGKSRGVGLQIP